MDYRENCTCLYQDEAHWTREQVTVHPVVSYCWCLKDPDEIVQETFFYVFDDIKHDNHEMHNFKLQVVRNLLQRGLNFQNIVHFSDAWLPKPAQGRLQCVCGLDVMCKSDVFWCEWEVEKKFG